MGIPVPELGWWQWVWTYVVSPIAGGSTWPLTDEDLVRLRAQAWRDLQALLLRVGQNTSVSLTDMAMLWDGPSAEAYRQRAYRVLGAVQQLVDGAGDIADQADDAALAIEYEKNTIVLSVIACCFELAAILASMFFTGGLSALFGAGPILVARGIVERVFLQTMQRLSGKFLGRLAVEGLQEGLQEVFTSVMAQLAQILEGTRDGFDGSLIRDSGLGGGAGGVAGDLTAPFVRGGKKALDNVSNPVARNVGDIALQGTHDSFANSVGNITVNGLVYGQTPTLGDLVPGPDQIVSGGIREKIGDRAHQAYKQIGDAAGWSNLAAPVVAPPPGTTSPPATTAPPVATSPPATTAPPAATTSPVTTRPPATAVPPPSGAAVPPPSGAAVPPPSGTTALPPGNVLQGVGDSPVQAGPSASPPGTGIQAPPTGVDSPGLDIGSPAGDPTAADPPARRPEADLGAAAQAGGPGSSTGNPGPTPGGNSPLPGTGPGQPDLVGSGVGQIAPSAGPTGEAGLAQSRADPVGSAPPVTEVAQPSVPAGPQVGQPPAVVPGQAAGTSPGASAPPTSASPLMSTPRSTASGRSSSTTGQSSVPGRDRPPSGIGRVDGPPAGDPERPRQHATDPVLPSRDNEPLLVPADPEAWAAAGPHEPAYSAAGRPDPEEDPGTGLVGEAVPVGAGRPVDTSWTALEIPGAPSGVGWRNADAGFAALLSSLDRGIVGVPRPTRIDRAARTVRVPRLGGGPELLYTVGPTPLGTRAMRSQVVERDVDGTPVIRVVISDRLPRGADLGHGLQQRDLWLARILVHEPTEAEALRKTGFVSRLRRLVRDPGGGTWTPHDEGHRAEVRYLVGQVMELETAGRRLAVREARRQLGLLLDHMGVGIPDPAASAAAHAGERLSRLALPPAELAVVTPMLAADAPWRSDLLPGERRRVRRALQAVADDLVSVGRGAPGRQPTEIQLSWVRNQGVEMRIGDRAPVIVDTRSLILRLAHSGLHGSALSALALDELGVALSTVLAAVDDPGLRQDPRFARPDLLIAHALAHRYGRLAARPPQRPGTLEETLRRFRVRVATLTAAEAFELAGAVQDADLASPVRQRTVTALVRETVTTVYGDGTDTAPGQVEVLSGSRVRLTPAGQRPVELVLPRSVADLAGAEGSGLDAVRAELAGYLGARLAGPFDRSRSWRRTTGGDAAIRGALTALTRLHLDPTTTAGTRAAAERQFRAVLTGTPYGRESGAERVLAGLAPEVRRLWQRLAGPDPAGSPEETHAPLARRQPPASPRQATPQEVEEKLAALWQQLRTRWELGGSGGRQPRRGSFVRGMEPLALTGESVRVRIHTREGRWYDAEIRVGDPGSATDQAGNRLPAFSQIVTDRGPGETGFRMWIPADRPNNNDLVATTEHEAEELVVAAERRSPEATSFVITADREARIGAYLLNDPASRAAARDAVVGLREVLRALNPGDHEAVDNAFLRDDPTGSGQVGPGVPIDALVADGTTRELMTALYNAAFLSEAPTDFVHSVLRLAGTGEPGWRTMRDAGIDTGALAGYLEFVARAKGFAAGDPSYHDVITSRDFTNKEHLAGYFGRHGDEAARDLAIDLLRQKRPLDARGPYQVTRGDLQRLGVDLGKFELAYQAKILGHVPESETVLPWVSGEAWFVPDHMTEWYEKVVHELGMPVLTGPAGSASRLYVINDLMNPGADHEAFLGAMIGWMLAGRDHSSYEIVQALRGVGYGKEGAPTKIADPADLYQSVPGLKVSPREALGAAADGAGRPSAPGRVLDPHQGTEKPTGPATVPAAASPAGGEHPGPEPEPDREGTTWGIPEFPRTLPDGDPLLEPTFTIDTPTRRAFRQGLIDKALANATPPEDGRPVLYLMGGGVASGKSTVLQMLQESGEVPKENVAFLSPDEFKKPIPEYKLVIAAGDSMASSAVQSESGIMFGTARDEAIQHGVNIICDVTLGNPSGGLRTIQKGIDAGYEVRLYGVTADAASAVVRNADRAAETGRYVPTDVLLKAHQGFSEGFRAYAEAVDHAELWDNSGDGGPTLIAGKAPGGELEVLDERAFADFERKAELDPMAAGPDSLFPEPDHAVTTADTTGHADQADHGTPAEQPGPPDHPANHQSDIPLAPMPTVHDVLGDAFTSAQYRRALTDRARDVARHNGTTPEVELQQFVLLRAVSRIFAEAPDAWLLKGGLSFLARFPDGRPTTDLDLIRLTEGGVERMAEDYNTALTRDHGDGLRFELDSSVPVAAGRGVRIGHRVLLGDAELMPLSVDLVPNRTVPGRPESQTLWRSEEHPFPDQIFRFEGASEPENIRILSLDGFLRQKLAAMYTYDKDAGLLPRRPNDLVDLALLAVKTSWDGPATHALVREEFDIRWEQGEKLHLPEEFANPNPAWVGVFADRAATTPGLPFTRLAEALPLLKKFIDPFLREESPNADWDHRVMEWIPRDQPADVHGPQPARAGETIAAEDADRTTARTTGDTRATGRPVAPLTRGIPADYGAIDPASVKLIAATGHGPPSTVFAEPSRISEWDRLAGGGEGSVAAKVSEVLADATLPTLESKLGRINDDVLPVAGLPSRIESLDSKNLRFYSYMAGELFIHSSALMIDPHTTIEVGYHRGQVFRDYSKEAQARQLSYTGELPDGMTREQAVAVALWRSTRGLSTADVPPEELVHDFLTMHAQPLVDALTMRDRMINEYGIAPERIRLAYGGPPESDPGRGKSRTTRAHIHSLAALRDDPEGAWETMVQAMTGTGDVATARDARAQAVVDRIDAAAEALGRSPDKIALLWVRDQRANPTANRNGLDTQPGVLRQLIELTRAEDPDRHIVLVGDDVFRNRTGLREAWEHDGVLTGVDTTTMVKFWDKDLNDGQALGFGEQALVFNKLLSRDVVQIGTESGALEIPFLLGMPTVYLENLVFHLNKGNRWLYMSQEWHYGRFEVDTGPTGSVRLDAAGHPVRIFHADRDPLPPPLPTVARVQFGPDLALPKDRQHVPKDFPQQRVALTADRLYRLVESGELDNWAARLGHEKSPADKADGGPAEWTPEQWKRSEYYANQLQRRLHTNATPEDVSRKWDSIRLALRGILDPSFDRDPEINLRDVLDPSFDRDPEINNGTVVHPYFTLHTDHGVPPAEADLLARAYAAAPEERGAAVVAALKALLGDPGLRERAVRDELLFQLSAAELANLRESVARVLAASGRSAWGNGGDGAARADSGS